MTLSLSDANILRQAGFLESEVNELANAVTLKGEPQPPVDITSPVWQATLNSRKDWWLDKLGRGWEEHEIRSELENYYKRDKSRTPWDFLKAEYRSPRRVDYIEIVRKRHQAQIESELEGYRFK